MESEARKTRAAQGKWQPHITATASMSAGVINYTLPSSVRFPLYIYFQKNLSPVAEKRQRGVQGAVNRLDSTDDSAPTHPIVPPVKIKKQTEKMS